MPAPTPYPPDGNRRSLAARHAQVIADSCISEDVRRERGYFTANETIQLRGFGWNRSRALSQILPGLVIPVDGALGNGAVSYAVIRPDAPRRRAGKPVKYEVLWQAGNVVDVSPRVREVLGDPHTRLWITEGIRKVSEVPQQAEPGVTECLASGSPVASNVGGARRGRWLRNEPPHSAGSPRYDFSSAWASLPSCARIMRARARARDELQGPLDGPSTRTDSPDIHPDREA
jgi:hypothetical protein